MALLATSSKVLPTHRAILTPDNTEVFCLLNFLRKWVTGEFKQHTFLFNQYAYHSEEAIEARDTGRCCIMYSLGDQSSPLINIHSELPEFPLTLYPLCIDFPIAV